MSYTIEYKRFVFEEKDEHENRFWAFVQEGDSNVFDAGTHRRSRDWTLMSYGTASHIIGEVCRRAAATESRSLQFPGERYISPEEYLATWRKAMQEVIPFHNILSALPIYAGGIILHQKTSNKYEQENVEKIMLSCLYDGEWYGYKKYSLEINNPSDLKKWRELSSNSMVYLRTLRVKTVLRAPACAIQNAE